MSWVGVGVAAVGAIAGSRTANANRKRARAHDQYRKAAITYSPWTGMGDPGAANVGNTDSFTGMLGGAAQGYALGSGIGGAFKGMGGAAGGGMATSASSPLGGQAMSQELGKMGTNVGKMQSQLGGTQGMWSNMAQSQGMGGSAGALGSATNSMFKQPQNSWLGMGQQPTYNLGMNYGG